MGHSVEPGSPTQFANVSAALLHGVYDHTATGVNLCSSAIGQPVANLERRNIYILGIEGVIQPSGKLGCPPRLADRRALSAYRPCPPKGDTLQISAIN